MDNFIQVIDDGATLKLLLSGNPTPKSVSKQGITITVNGDTVFINDNIGKSYSNIYSNVTSPATGSADALRIAIENMLETGSGAGATEATLVGVLTAVSNNNAVVDGFKNVTTAGTAETLFGSATPCRKIFVTANKENTGDICIGASTVVAAVAGRRGHLLEAGDSVPIDIDDASKLYIDSTVNGEGVSFLIQKVT